MRNLRDSADTQSIAAVDRMGKELVCLWVQFDRLQRLSCVCLLLQYLKPKRERKLAITCRSAGIVKSVVVLQQSESLTFPTCKAPVVVCRCCYCCVFIYVCVVVPCACVRACVRARARSFLSFRHFLNSDLFLLFFFRWEW